MSLPSGSRSVGIENLSHLADGCRAQRFEHLSDSTHARRKVGTCTMIHDSDFLILRVTAESGEDALDQGGSLTAICRWSKFRVEKLETTLSLRHHSRRSVILGRVDGIE